MSILAHLFLLEYVIHIIIINGLYLVSQLGLVNTVVCALMIQCLWFKPTYLLPYYLPSQKNYIKNIFLLTKSLSVGFNSEIKPLFFAFNPKKIKELLFVGRTGESSPIIIVLIKSNRLSCAHEQETH